MNLPVNNIVVKDIFLKELDVPKLFIDLESRKFTGYLALIITGKYSFEESFVILDSGKICGAIYLIDQYDVILYGQKAFDLSMNAFSAKKGVLNIFELNQDQLKLVLLFNNKINFVKIINGKKYKKQKKHFLNNLKIYDPKIVEEILDDKIETKVSKKRLLDERGLDQLLEI